VIDKQITPRWLAYERLDTVIGSVVVILGTATLIARRLGPVPGDFFVLILLNAALIGAAAVTLATTYAFGDVFKTRHSLHRRFADAKGFYAMFSGLVILAAAIVLIPNAPLGLVTLGVQALAGILLPSASVFLLLLSNDHALLGPWANPRWLNVIASVIIGILVILSAIVGAVTLFPGVNVPLLVEVLGGTLVVAVVLVLAKIVQLAVAGTGHA
jgi:Mn2+/Fe2+ NRAMP family transporter